MEKTIEFLISGRVQGVGYRAYVANLAKKYQLKGQAENLFNGKVKVLLNMPEDLIDEIIEKFKIGPSLSKVDSIDWVEVGKQNFIDFSTF